MTPYATGTMSKKKRGGGAATEDVEGYGEEGEAAAVESEEEEEGVENDTMIKVCRSGVGYCGGRGGDGGLWGVRGRRGRQLQRRVRRRKRDWKMTPWSRSVGQGLKGLLGAYSNPDLLSLIPSCLHMKCNIYYAPLWKKEGHIALHMSVGRYVGIP